MRLLPTSVMLDPGEWLRDVRDGANYSFSLEVILDSWLEHYVAMRGDEVNLAIRSREKIDGDTEERCWHSIREMWVFYGARRLEAAEWQKE